MCEFIYFSQAKLKLCEVHSEIVEKISCKDKRCLLAIQADTLAMISACLRLASLNPVMKVMRAATIAQADDRNETIRRLNVV